VEPGNGVEVALHGARRRGVVVSLGDEAPPGVEPARAGPVVDRLPAPLVELALWLAEYYGSTPARALQLVAPVQRRRRGERAEPAAREALPGESEPERLSDAQRAALERITTLLDGGEGGNVLLYGATGSGKTEVYLQACAVALERGLGAIVLVPEIALAPQTLGRFRARFGDRVALLHSALTDAERRDERERVAAGEAPIVVGARSAVFAPVPRLGLICVDEEHDASYKQDSDPRYDARTVAAKRSGLEGAVAVYGSATPRPESWARPERLAPGGRLRCHHCGWSEPAPEVCPSCGSPELARLGAGTQRLERELEARLPELERIRLDADAVARPGALAEALGRFAGARGAVLLGTQMVAKGHHFAGVDLAAVVDADTGLGLPDFRAEERTFQLLTQ